MFKRSPAPFVPPIPPDVTSSSESSPVLQGQGYNPDIPPHTPSQLGRPGGLQPLTGPPGSPQQGFIGVPGFPYAPPAGFQDYAEFEEFQRYQQESQMNGMGMVQRYKQNKQPPAQQVPGLRSPGGPRGADNRQVGGYLGGGQPFGYAPAAAPQGYGFSPYAAPSPYPYAPAGGFPYGGGAAQAAAAAAAMYGGQTPGPFMTPYMTPLPTPGLLDPGTPAVQAQGLGGMGRPGQAGGGGGSVIGRPGQQQHPMAVGKWMPGPDYAPVLSHLAFNIVKPPVVEIHPLLRAIAESRDTTDPFLVFDILFPTNTIHVSTEPPRKSWSKGRKDPATFPRLSVIRLITRYTNWVIQVTSDSPGGVTVADVVTAIHEHFRINASEEDDWSRLEPATQSEVLMAYKWNRSTEMGAPGGIMPDALLRGDFLMERTMFAGLKPADPGLAEEKMDIKNFPATFELQLHTR